MFNTPTQKDRLHQTDSVYSARRAGSLAATAFMVISVAAASLHAEENGIDSLRRTGTAFATVAKKVSPAVVFVKIEKTLEVRPSVGLAPFGGNDLLRRFFGMPYSPNQPGQIPQAPRQEEHMVGQGSGFIISPDGYILTNNHVVGGADKVLVKLADGRQFTAKTIGTDPHSDVAVIKIDADNLPILPFGDSENLEVGEWVLAIGNPFGLSHSLTAGIVSAKGRNSIGITDYEDFIQTDAAINPGNSGGPLVNLEGQAVGMNTAIESRTGTYMGIGFAIPINMARAIARQLINEGSVTRGYLGVYIQDLTPELAKSFGFSGLKGVVVAQVNDNSPAREAGMVQGDVILEFRGKPIGSAATFRNQVALTAPGTEEQLLVWHDGSRKTLTVTIGTLPDGGLATTASSHTADKLGLTVKTLTRDLAQQGGYQGQSGVIVTQVGPDSLAALAGIRPGMLIKEVNRKPVTDADDFKRAVDATPERGSVLMLVQDGPYSRYVALSIE